MIQLKDGGDLPSTNIDELIYIRSTLRESKSFALMDSIRDFLDSNLVFVFDGVNGQEVYYLTERYFKNKIKFQHTNAMTNRKYVEYRIKQDIKSEALFQSWLFSNSHQALEKSQLKD